MEARIQAFDFDHQRFKSMTADHAKLLTVSVYQGRLEDERRREGAWPSRSRSTALIDMAGGFRFTAHYENETVKKLMLAGMLAVPQMASVAWADCLKDDPYYRCFDWYHASPGEVYTPPASVKTLAGQGKWGKPCLQARAFARPF